MTPDDGSWGDMQSHDGDKGGRSSTLLGLLSASPRAPVPGPQALPEFSAPAQPAPNSLLDTVPTFLLMTGNHRNTNITRRRALAVTGGTVAAGRLAVAGYRSAFADTGSTAEATTTASATGACMTLMSSVTEGPYYLDGALVYDGGGASSGLLTLKAVHKADPSKGYNGSLTLATDPDAENTGAGSGGGGTPPSGAPSDAPTGTPPSDSASPSASASS